MILEDVFEEVNFTLFAIHCTLVDYRLAYLLNENLDTNLKRKEEDLDYDNVSASYSIFEWQDTDHLRTWNLINNKSRSESNTIMDEQSLFGKDERSFETHNLILEYKNVDYFLKVSTESIFPAEKDVLAEIQEIPQIVTAYMIDASNLKSRNNLIFN